MLEKLYQIRDELNDAIAYAELQDLACTKDYTALVRKYRAINRTIKRFERIDRGLVRW